MKPKCPKCGHPLDSYATWRREVESHPFGVACAKCKWVRMVSRAAIIRLATQGKCNWRERAEELQDTLGLAQLAAETWKHRAEAAEAERDSLRRQLAQAVKAR